jgi:hypothetical protein
MQLGLDTLLQALMFQVDNASTVIQCHVQSYCMMSVSLAAIILYTLHA